MEGFNTSGALVIDAEAYAQPSHTTNQMGGGGDLAGLSPTPLTPSGGASSMWGAPTSSAGKFIVEMDEGGWMHTYHATVYEAPNGQRIQFRTSAVNTASTINTFRVVEEQQAVNQQHAAF